MLDIRILSENGSKREGSRGSVEGAIFEPSLSKVHNRPLFEYVTGASLLKVSRGGEKKIVYGGLRGRIIGFSRASRRRLLYTIARIMRSAILPMFVTLTYPNIFPDPEKSKRDLKIFLQRLIRKFPRVGIIWKLEPQERGAPHYHLLIWGVPFIELLIWVPKNWYLIAGNGDEYHLKWHRGELGNGNKPCVSQVKSWKGVWSYASKYLGKTFDVAGWGQKWTGRFWGVVNRENIPFGNTVKMEIERYKAVQAMRYQRRFSRLRVRNNQTLTIFCDADQWVSRLNLLN
jgi:hypothetical protein